MLNAGPEIDSGLFCFCVISAKQNFWVFAGPLKGFLKMEFIYDEQSTPIALLTPELKAEFEQAGLFRMLDPYYQYLGSTPKAAPRHLVLVVKSPNP